MSTKHLFQPDYAIHPGETLAETLEDLGLSQAELAQRTGRPLQVISEIIQGKKAITAETALQLERATGVPASFWNSAQRNYEAARARLEEERGLIVESACLDQFPLAAMVKRRWVPRDDTKAGQMRILLNFFGVAGIKEWKNLWQSPQVAFRKSSAFEANPMAVASWLRQGERLAQQVRVAPYDQDAFIKALHEIRCLTNADPVTFEPQAKALCRAAGVALVFVPELPVTRVYGATQWLTSRKALVQLSLRGRSDDFLWFTFFHEAAHILKHGKRDVFIEATDGTTDEDSRRKEEEADTFSSDFLIPRDAFITFRKAGRFTSQSIQRFAAELGISPGIVVGRLQHEKLIPFNQHNGLKRRFFLNETAK